MKSSLTNRWCQSLLVLLLPLALTSAVHADEVTDWHAHMLVALGQAGLRPPLSTRDAALVSAAVFDAVNGIERRYTSIHVHPAAPRGASKRAAAVQAAYVVLRSRFPQQADELSSKRNASLAAIGDGTSTQRGVEWGQTVAEAILTWRSTDGFTPPPPAYVGGEELGRWRPTPPGFASGVAPQLATLIPWAMLAPNQFRPGPPPALDSEQYAADLLEVQLKGSDDSVLRTADQTTACFFAANTSGTYVWNRVAMELSAIQGADLSENAQLLATLNLAIADAVIACWDAKQFYEYWRPVTALQLLDADEDGNPDDPTWTPLLPTPAHPDYTSGHSSIYGAAATVLAAYFGEDTPFVLVSQTDPQSVRFYPSFPAALAEVADARVFAGIHFRTACEVGKDVGSEVARYVMDTELKRLHGAGE